MTKPNDIPPVIKPEVEPTLTAVPDMFDLEVRLEEFYGNEIKKLEDKLAAERSSGHKLRQTCYGIIARVDPNLPMVAIDLENPDSNEQTLKALEEVKKRIDRGIHLQQLIDAIEANELLKPQWKRLMVSLRMVE